MKLLALHLGRILTSKYWRTSDFDLNTVALPLVNSEGQLRNLTVGGYGKRPGGI